MTAIVEQGDIYFFYRPKVNTDSIESLDDVQRLHLVLAPDDSPRARLFLVGKKRLPEIIKGESRSTEREWMMNDMTGEPKQVGRALAPVAYQTKTRGEQQQGEAIPAGEGRYVVFEARNSSRLAYRLHRPDQTGTAQQELGILPEASFVISVRNPELDVPGFPDAKPDYPESLQEKFADRRWLDIGDSRLLDYENAQFLLVGAHADLGEEGIEVKGQPDLFGTLGLEPQVWPTEALEEGELAEPEMQAGFEAPKGDRSKGGERGGKAATETASAAGIAKALKGMDFPCDKSDLIEYAQANQAAGEVVEVLQEFPDRQYRTMADVQKAVGEVR